ncbi:unnamed protein product [Dracunculus medinensis]|uniref:protein-tyrosine-phosphatase n=1 Tax=Dracunculus medinensis TaxID=318479 RepID=A0A0N4UCC4_DRAME|nr:unnamed protein product [Dracunculus medinensis]
MDELMAGLETKAAKVVMPNVNFLNQLKIFEKCHYKTDSITLSKCVEAINIPNQVGCYINCLEYPVFSKNESRIEEGIYRCRKCRQALFFNQHIVKHASLNEQKDSLGEKNSACKLRYIVEPLKWMALDAVSGNIRCYKCGEKLGDFNWAGKFCNITYEHGCGAFVVPWVFINEKKVDLCTVSSNSNIILPIIPVCSDSNERYNSPEDSRSSHATSTDAIKLQFITLYAWAIWKHWALGWFTKILHAVEYVVHLKLRSPTNVPVFIDQRRFLGSLQQDVVVMR